VPPSAHGPVKVGTARGLGGVRDEVTGRLDAPACGVDLALRLLERAAGPDLAAAAARALGYERPAVEVG
jgi:hypothetical protein